MTSIIHEAETFIRTCYTELGKQPSEAESRIAEIKREMEQTGSYTHTTEELTHGAKMAWRNSNRCIGRLFWNSLHVLDERALETEPEMADALIRHIRYATNGGKIIPTITVFRPKHEQNEVRLWNYQLIRYAGYETKQGIVGDPASLTLTKACEELGWKGAGTPFDILPLVIQKDGGKPQWFPIPEEHILEVPIRHPQLPEFEQLQLKWYAVPIVSDMRLEIGGVQYCAAPFNGWYMGTEIGARNLADENRYNVLPAVAKLMGLDPSRNQTLWKDRALVELNIAVLHSFKQQGVSMVDHHTAATQFKRFEANEKESGRPLTGDWTWLIPPLSPATTHIFHHSYQNTIVNPNFYYQARPYESS